MYKRYLLSAASVAALATITFSSPGMAFETIDWDWYLDVKTDFKLRENIKLKTDPAGATIVEVEQDFKGDAYATAWATKIDVDYGQDVTVTNSAAALGNSVSIETETAAFVDVNQRVRPDYYGADFDAYASMWHVWVDASGDAEVTNSAAAIANNFSLTVDPLCGAECVPGVVGPEDMLAIVNVRQSAWADAYAWADMYDVDVDAGGDVDVTNSAVAAGNLVNITVVRGAIPFPDQD